MESESGMTAASVRLAGWCGPVLPPPAETTATRSARSLKAEAAGYVAMLTFLVAYLLNVAGGSYVAQVALNLTGSAVGALYLAHKKAIPSVISNLAWAAITVASLIVRA